MTLLIHAKFKVLQKKADDRNPGQGYEVRFYDRDLVDDDFLGAATLKGSGDVSVPVEPKKFSNQQWSPEALPDIYFKIYRDGDLIHKSKVFKNIPWILKEDNQGKKNLVYELGDIVI